MSNRLKDRIALVIGGGSGIGRAVCRIFAEEGADVAVADLPSQTGKAQLCREISRVGRRSLPLDVDVRNPPQIVAAIDETINRFGHLDILVNNAGVSAPAQSFVDDSAEQWQQILSVNLLGIAIAMRHVIPHMLGRGFGRIINTASQLAHKPSPGNAMYCASKAGVVALTVSVAQEVAQGGITINSVCPGPTDTPMWNSADPGWNKAKLESLPIRRIATPQEVAWAYVYLASDEAAFMVGQSISPNGGDVMW
jgi:NAD(P)-dependent dehydrogenase (short-subunit alcohol dehydrogenase family)